MKKLFAVLALVIFASVFVIACGGSKDDGPLDATELASAADRACTDGNRKFDDLGVRGLSNPMIALELEGTAEARQSTLDGLQELEADESVKADWQEYLDETAEIVSYDRKIAKAARADDTDGITKAYADQGKVFTQRDKTAKAFDFKVCNQIVETDTGGSGTAPDEGVKFAEPKNDVAAAADSFLSAVAAGDCDKVAEEFHTDATQPDGTMCESFKTNYKGAKVAGTEQFGPVGQADIAIPNGVHYEVNFVEDLDGTMKFAGDAIHDYGGLKPAPEDNDAQQNLDAAMAAIDQGDSAAFNEAMFDSETSPWKQTGKTFDTFSEGEFNRDLVDAIRGGAEPESLGITAAFAYSLIKGDKYDFVIYQVHQPGSGGHYRMSAYFPIPKSGGTT